MRLALAVQHAACHSSLVGQVSKAQILHALIKISRNVLKMQVIAYVSIIAYT